MKHCPSCNTDNPNNPMVCFCGLALYRVSVVKSETHEAKVEEGRREHGGQRGKVAQNVPRGAEVTEGQAGG